MVPQFLPYQKLRQRAHQIALLTSTAEALTWDVETYMPPKALDFRAEQLAHFGGMAHRLLTAKKVGEGIAACEQHGFPADSPEAANLREWRRQYDRAVRLPARLVEKLERARAHAREAWKEARSRSEFKLFKPHLKKLLELSRQKADYWGYEQSPYDALLEEYEPGARVAHLRVLFDELRPALAAIVGPASERSASAPADLLAGQYPIAAQQAFNQRVAEAMGFDFAGGRVDTSAHPLCTTLGPGDCRICNRYSEQDFTESLYSILHEAGHGLYEQGLPVDHFGTPLGIAASLGVHESQSRLWENHIGRHQAFWEYWHPIVCEYFPGLSRFTPAQITAVVNRVQPSYIRVAADQVTYDLHILLRFDLEVKLVAEEITVADVPAYWNEEFERLLGLKVRNDAEGCLQDIHWSIGSFGYFPTYTLGNLNAAQILHRICADLPGFETDLATGQYASILRWLREKIHMHGLRYTPPELIRRATGESTRSRYHLEYLRARFLS
jgi:carboxypeptidase Taq